MSMIYTIQLDRSDDGAWNDAGEDLTPQVLALAWRIGMAAAGDAMAAPGWARITLRSAGQPLPTPGTGLRLLVDAGDGPQLLFVGQVARIEPAPGEYGPRTLTIHADCGLAALQRGSIGMPAAQSLRTDELIRRAVDAARLRYPALEGLLLLDAAAQIGVGRLAGAAWTGTLDEGRSFCRPGGKLDERRSPAAWIAAAVERERGRFFATRSGALRFLQRQALLKESTPLASFSDDMAGLALAFGADFANRIELRVQPGILGEANALLWQMAQPLRLEPGQTLHLRAFYRDQAGRRVGALTLDPLRPGLDWQASDSAAGSGADRTALLELRIEETGSDGALLALRSLERSRALYLTRLELRGTPLLPGDPALLALEDGLSQTRHGLRVMQLAPALLDDLGEAEQIARYELARRSQPRSVAHWIEIDLRQHPAALGRTLYERIALHETQSGHSGQYWIICEEHAVLAGGARHWLRWLLEPCDDARFIELDAAPLDGLRALAY